MGDTASQVRKRPPLLRALGKHEPPDEVTVAGEPYRLETVFKHDSWAATALYAGADGRRVVCKFNRVQPIFVLSMRWLGRALARREAGFLRRLSDIVFVPRDLGPVTIAGQPLPHAVARNFIDGDVFRDGKQVAVEFFTALRTLIAAVHAHGIAYVDLHKRENIIVGRDGMPYLIDFQVSLGVSQRWPGNGAVARFTVRKLQEIDDYHVRKHIARCIPETLTAEERARYLEPPSIIRWHRTVFVPLRTLRRRLLTALRVRGASGQAQSEADPEVAFRPPPEPPSPPSATMQDRTTPHRPS